LQRLTGHYKAQAGLAALGLSVRSSSASLARINNPLRRRNTMSTSTPTVNSITLVGRLTRDPVARTLPNGRTVCDLRLAVSDRGTSPIYVDVSTFGKPAEACAKYLSKGRQVAVTGRLAYSEWTAHDGTKRSKHSIIGLVQFGARPGAGTPSGEVSVGESAESVLS
jgi:single-strand DNA-binding protein